MWDADVRARRLHSAYGIQESCRLVRGSWFVESRKGDWRPLREEAADAVERAFATEHADGAAETRVELPSGGAHALLRRGGEHWLVTPVAYLSSEGMTITMGALGGLMRRGNGSAISAAAAGAEAPPPEAHAGQQQSEQQQAVEDAQQQKANRPAGGMRLRRGLPKGAGLTDKDGTLARHEAYLRAPPSRVALVVHGIGQAGFSSSGGDSFDVTFNATDLAKSCEAVAGDKKRVGKGKDGDIAARAFPVLPVQWRKNLTLPPDVMLEKAMPPCSAFAKMLRRTAQLTVTDVLYYMAPQYRSVILDSLVKALHRICARFIRRNPRFAGSINIVGHSLGTVLMYDLLSNQPVDGVVPRPTTAPKLRLDVADLVLMGSPLAVFLSLRGAYLCDDREGFAGERRPRCQRILNVMHPYDPVAYRVEPLVGDDLCAWDPVKIGNYQTGDLLLHHKLAEMSRGASGAWARAITKVSGAMSVAARLMPGRRAEAAASNDIHAAHGVEAEARAAAAAAFRPAALSAQSAQVLESLSGAALPHGRLDFQLQEGMLESSLVGAALAHFCYWSNADLALFLLQNIGAAVTSAVGQ